MNSMQGRRLPHSIQAFSNSNASVRFAQKQRQLSHRMPMCALPKLSTSGLFGSPTHNKIRPKVGRMVGTMRGNMAFSSSSTKSTHVTEAWKFFNKLVQNKEAHVYDFHLMMKACKTSDEQRRILDVDMRQTGVKPDLFTYNTHLEQLVFEGDMSSARNILKEEMLGAGIEPSERSWEIFHQADEDLNRMRSHHLSKLWEIGSSDSFTEARAFFKKLVENKKANVIHANITMKMYSTSDDHRRIIDVDMHQGGIEPDIGTYNMLVKQLVFEGNMPAARKVVGEEMPGAGVNPDKRTQSYLDMNPRSLRKMRIKYLYKLLDSRDGEEMKKACDFFAKLIRAKQAHVTQFNLMMKKACKTSDEQRRLLDVVMPKAGVRANDFTYNPLVVQLMLEGDVSAARKVVHEEMPARGLRPKEKALNAIQWSGEKLKKMSEKHLVEILQQTHGEKVREAKQFFDKVVKNRQVTAYHFALMMRKMCSNSDEQRRLLQVDMPTAGIKPNSATYDVLVDQLVLEGDIGAAQKVVEVEMPANGIEPSHKTWRALRGSTKTKKLSRRRTTYLSQLLTRKSAAAKEKARFFFRKLVETKQADVFQFNVMMKACNSSEEQRRLLEVEMTKAGVKPDAITYMPMVNQLMLEDNHVSARRVVEEEMPALGIRPNSHLWEHLHTPPQKLKKMRIHYLNELATHGGKKEVAQARRFFNKMLKNKQADVDQFAIMMKLCESTDEQRYLLDEEMPKQGIEPNTTIYNILVRELILEGKVEEAHQVVTKEMPAKGVKALSATWKNFHLPAESLSRMRTTILSKLLVHRSALKDKERAWSFFNKLVEEGQADIFQFNVMIRECISSDDQRRLLDVEMPKTGVTPDAVTYLSIVQQLIVEDDLNSARTVIEEEMPSLGITPHKNIVKSLDVPASEKNKLRMRYLKKLLLYGSSRETARAWQFFHRMVQNEQADMYHFELMMRHCKNSEEQRRLIDEELPKAGVTPGTLIFNVLVNQLVFEGCKEAARKVIEEEMAMKGIHPSKDTWRNFHLPAESLSRMRTKFLSKLLDQESTLEDREKAWSFFSKLVEQGQADVFQFNVMMKACISSDDQRRLLDVEMPKAGVKPNLTTYTALLKQLVAEDDVTSAYKIINDEITASGITLNPTILKSLRKVLMD